MRTSWLCEALHCMLFATHLEVVPERERTDDRRRWMQGWRELVGLRFETTRLSPGPSHNAERAESEYV